MKNRNKKLEIEEINNKFKITVGAGVKLGRISTKTSQ